MLNRKTLIGAAIALAAALLVAVLASPGTGPRPSQAQIGSTGALLIEGLHRDIEHAKMPLHSIPEP